MDRVTKNLINDFLKLHEIKSTEDSEDFEKFSNYSVISKEHSETFDIEHIETEKHIGIDGIAIIVNGRLVDSVDEVRDLKNMNGYLEAKFVFIQAKTSSSFDGGDIGTFGCAVKDFFTEKPELFRNEVVKRKIEIANYIYNHIGDMTRGTPICKLYYVTTGIWKDDINLTGRFNTIKDELVRMNYFQDVVYFPLGAKEIRQLYLNTKAMLEVEINFSNKVLLSQINGVTEAYVGILPFSEFRKIIIDDSDNIRPVFYDNVRAFQGDNKVNVDIEHTLKSDKIDKFAVFNNGITIVAKGLSSAANKLTLKDYQIVNGCQTSHVIFNNRRDEAMQNLHIPVKVIATEDEEVVNDIIKATNYQTIVKEEELEALSQFQKDLEQYYKTYEGESVLYYERRSKQFDNQPNIIKSRIITIPLQIKTFASMFLGLPHRVLRYYGTIVKDIGDNIFRIDHKWIPYYISALAYYKLESFFRIGIIDSKYKKCRFHILFAVRKLIVNGDMPPWNSDKIEAPCRNILAILNDDKQCKKHFLKAIKFIDFLGLDLNNRDNFKIATTTENLRKAIEAKMKK